MILFGMDQDAPIIRGTAKELRVYDCFADCNAKNAPRCIKIANYVFAVTRNANADCVNYSLAISENDTEQKAFIDQVFLDHGRIAPVDLSDIFHAKLADVNRHARVYA